MSKRGAQYYTTDTKRKPSAQGLSQNGIKTQKIKKIPQIDNLNNRIFVGTIRSSVQGDASDTHFILEQRNLKCFFHPFRVFCYIFRYTPQCKQFFSAKTAGFDQESANLSETTSWKVK